MNRSVQIQLLLWPTTMSEKAEEPTTGFFSPVAAFYEGKTIFITGATGFMGKVDYTRAKKNEWKQD